MFDVVGRTRLLDAQGLEDVRRVGAVVGHGADRGVPRRRAGVEQEQPADFGREHRGEGDRFGAAERVTDDDVRARLASRLQQRVEIGGLRRERLRGWWRVACAGAEAVVGTHAGGLGNGRFDRGPVARCLR